MGRAARLGGWHGLCPRPRSYECSTDQGEKAVSQISRKTALRARPEPNQVINPKTNQPKTETQKREKESRKQSKTSMLVRDEHNAHPTDLPQKEHSVLATDPSA